MHYLTLLILAFLFLATGCGRNQSGTSSPTVGDVSDSVPPSDPIPTPTTIATPTPTPSPTPSATPAPVAETEIKLFDRVIVKTKVSNETRFIEFPAGKISFYEGESFSLNYFKEKFGFKESHFVFTGKGSDATSLEFLQRVEIAFAVSGDGVQVDIRNLSLAGKWRGLQASGVPIRYAAETWGQLWTGWNKAILVRAEHGTVTKRPKVVVGPDVTITGFYYGVTAEEAADAELDSVKVFDAGDAAYFAYYGGRVSGRNLSAERSADLTKGLGHGFVAETLYYESSYDTDKTYKVRSCRLSASEPDPTLNPNPVVQECLASLGQSVPDERRSRISVENSFSNLHLYAGFVANMGADIRAVKSFASNAIAKDENGNMLMALNDSNLARPQPFAYGAYDAGSGFVSRYGSRITADSSYSFNNLIGFLSWANSEMSARQARAWNNSYFGFHATRMGRVDAVQSGSFGKYQKYGYGVDTVDSAMRVDGAKVGTDVVPFYLNVETTITPDAIGGFSTSSQVKQSPLVNGVTGFFYVE